MKANYTHVSMLLDRSGSMENIKNFIIEGFNSFISEQKKVPGEMTVTLVQFDSKGYDILHNFKNVQDIPPLTTDIFEPRDYTPLNDSWVRLIDETGAALSAMNEADRPEKVLCISFTDGLENDSKKYSPAQGGDEFIRKLVEQQENIYGWKFLFVGSDQDAKKEGLKRGMKNYVSSKGTGQSLKATYHAMNVGTQSFRTSTASTFNVKADVDEQGNITEEDESKNN